ncbi:transposase [Streptomyces sp. NPDC057199]|uniref:transposase n=1 Tax=Streptomyces sp. NPDC057199 TaxID=3346047 RepID=UPI0036375907
MRYAQGGGLTAERRRLRERIRYEAGERFIRGERTTVIAKDLRVSERSVERWRRAWREGRMDALASTGPPKLPKLSDAQFTELEKELALGPAEHGWEGQRWTLVRIRALIAFTSDYRDLVVRAHIQLGAPIVLIWDNLNTHRAAGMREYADGRDWLTIIQLPSYAPDLNPVEGIWSLLCRGPLANIAFTDDDHLERTLRRGLRHIQHRPDLIDGCLADTGLTLTRHPTTPRRDQ